ncbi:MAG: hypothetical protein C4333_02660 [Meiothermus sp.]
MWLCLVVALAACGGAGGPGGGGVVTNDFTMTCTPGAFSVPKGGQATLTVTVENLKGQVAKVQLKFESGTVGVDGSPLTQVVEGAGSAQFTISVKSGITDNKPFFYIYGRGMNSENRTSGMPQKDCRVQWSH